MPLGGYKGAGRTDRVVAESSKKHVSFKSGFESRERFAANRKHTTFQHQHNKIQTTRNFQETFEDVIALQSFFPRISYRTCAVTDMSDTIIDLFYILTYTITQTGLIQSIITVLFTPSLNMISRELRTSDIQNCAQITTSM